MAHQSRTGDGSPPTGPNEYEESRESHQRLRTGLTGSRVGALYQKVRNPSTRTGILMLVLAVLIVSAPFIPQWVRNTQEGLDARRENQERFEASLISEDLLVPSQVLPYVNRRVVQMANAASPVDWYAIDFVSGPCSEPHFAQMKDGKYKSALQSGCGEIQAVQTEFSTACGDALCDIPVEARTRLFAAVTTMYEEFSDAGMVLPYSFEEQVVGP